MAKYIITAPDGTKYQVTAPDGTTQAQVLAYVQSQHPSQEARAPSATLEQIAQALKAADAAGDTASAQRLAQAYRQQQSAPPPNFQLQSGTSADGVSRDALSDQYYRAKLEGRTEDANAMLQNLRSRGWTPNAPNAQQREALFQQVNAQNVASQPAIQTALQGVGQAFVNTGRGLAQLVGRESPQDVQESRRLDQALSNTNAGSLGNLVGQTAQTLAPSGTLGAGAKALGLAGRAVPYITSALAGGTFAGSQPVAPGESRAMNAALGVGAGVVGEAIPAGLRGLSGKAAPTVSLAKQDAIATAQQYGIPLHLNQVTDNRFLQTLGSASKYLPFSGTTAADAAQRTAFNRALASTIGQTADDLTPGVMAAARAQNGAGYDALFGRNTVQLQPGTWTRLGALRNEADQQLIPEQANVVKKQIQRFVDAAQANGGVIPGRLYQNVRQAVMSAENRANPQPYTKLIGQVRKTMQDAADNSFGGADAAELRGLNQQYSNLKILDKALGQGQGANYSVTPANLWRLVNSRYGSSPEMRQLAQLGQTVLKDPIANSGTAQREMAYRYLLGGGLGGAAYMEPHAMLPMLAGMASGGSLGRLMNSAWAARTLPYMGQNMLRGLSSATQPARYALPPLVMRLDGSQPIATEASQ